jgi:hypothetical protein
VREAKGQVLSAPRTPRRPANAVRRGILVGTFAHDTQALPMETLTAKELFDRYVIVSEGVLYLPWRCHEVLPKAEDLQLLKAAVIEYLKLNDGGTVLSLSPVGDDLCSYKCDLSGSYSEKDWSYIPYWRSPEEGAGWIIDKRGAEFPPAHEDVLGWMLDTFFIFEKPAPHVPQEWKPFVVDGIEYDSQGHYLEEKAYHEQKPVGYSFEPVGI